MFVGAVVFGAALTNRLAPSSGTGALPTNAAISSVVTAAVSPAAPTDAPVQTATPVPTATTHDMVVSITLYGDVRSISIYGSTCSGNGGYDDIDVGMQAQIHDPQGTIIGFGNFTTVGVPDDPTSPHQCKFSTVILRVPDEPSYGIAVGRRGTVQFSREDLAANHWNAELSIGP